MDRLEVRWRIRLDHLAVAGTEIATLRQRLVASKEDAVETAASWDETLNRSTLEPREDP